MISQFYKQYYELHICVILVEYVLYVSIYSRIYIVLQLCL